MERDREEGNPLSSGSDTELHDMLPCLVEMGHQWLWEQRDLHRAKARQLSGKERQLLKDYYDSTVLDKVRVATVDRISNPVFYEELKELGYPVIDLSQASGITFVDCVVIRSQFREPPSLWISILFHELVHVVQCEILGSRKLVESYLHSWLQNGYQYNAIPLEVQAQRLEARFDGDDSPFSVGKLIEEELRGLMTSAP